MNHLTGGARTNGLIGCENIKTQEKELKFVNLPREGTMPLTSYNDRYFREDRAPRI